MRALLFASVLGSVALILASCGHPVCVAGIGNCEVYRKWTTERPGSRKPIYTLSSDPSTVTVRRQATLKVTTNALGAVTGNCEWDIPTGGGGMSPDQTPTVPNAICTATYTAPDIAGTATIRVKEKNSGNIIQYPMTINP